MKRRVNYAIAGAILSSAIVLLSPHSIRAQESALSTEERNTLVSAAKEIMEHARYCALITLDETGHPQARTMDPFLPTENMHVWMGTNSSSRKVREIQNDSRVSLYYESADEGAYVVIQGNAILVNDPDKKKLYWKEGWNEFYPDKKTTFVLIEVVPEKLEIISYKHGITAVSKTWEVPHLTF